MNAQTIGADAPRPVWRARPDRVDWLCLFVVLAVALFFRFWQQGLVPPGMNFDEAFESLEARRLLLEPGYHPIYFVGNFGIPALNMYLTALAFRIGGESALAIRYVSAVIGTLGIGSLYFLARLLFPLPAVARLSVGKPGAAPPQGLAGSVPSAAARRFIPLVACLLLAVLPWHNAFSREGVEVIQVPLWATLAVLLLWQGLQTRRWVWFAASGFFWGSAYYTYQANWILPGMLVLFVIYKLVQEKGFLGRYWRHLLLLVLVAAVVVAPLVQFALQHEQAFVHRTTQVGIFGLGNGSRTPIESLLRNTVKVAGLFVVGGDTNVGNNIYRRPPLPLVLVAALVIGIGVALRRARQPAYVLLLIWFGWMLLPSILSEDAPSIRRALGSTPAMVLLMAVGLAWVNDAVVRGTAARTRWVPFARSLAGLAVVALLLYTGWWGYRYYFVEWGQNKDLYHWFDVGLVDIGRYAAETPGDTRLYYTPAGEGEVVNLPVTWQVRRRNLRTFDGRYGLILAPPDNHRSLYLVTTFLGDRWTLPELRRFYPHGRVVHEARDRYGELHSLAFDVAPGSVPDLRLRRLGVRFRSEIELIGCDLSAPTIGAGDTLTATLFWRPADGHIAARYTVFTHLLGAPRPGDGSGVWAGHDSPPIDNSYPTDRWQSGEIIVDRHPLVVPPDAPGGRYQIEVGLYAPQQNGARLPASDATGKNLGDSVVVASVDVQ